MAGETLVYVHGAGKQAKAPALKKELDGLLFGTNPPTTRVAYYADVRWPPAGAGPAAAGGASGRTRRERAVRRAAKPDLSPEAAADEVVRATLARPTGRVGAAAAGRVAPEDRRAATELAESLFRSADRVARRSSTGRRRLGAGPSFPDPIFRAIVGFFASDVIDYLFAGFADRMRAPVRATLLENPAPKVVIAHSLGTIITYDVLSEPAFKNRPLPLLVTVGSPLGIGNVQARLRDGAGRPNPVPKGVKAWANFADRFDPVALDATLRDAFEPPQDFAVDEAVNNGASNNHDLTGYLAIGVVATMIRQAMGR
jgi:hypothetical protein